MFKRIMLKSSGRTMVHFLKIIIAGALCILFLTGSEPSGDTIVIASDTIRLIQDGRINHYRATITANECRYKEELQVGDELSLYRKEQGDQSYSRIATYNIAAANPWLLSLGEMDGDEKLDLFIGAYRKTEFYPEEKRPYILTWNGEYLQKKWTGSYLNYKDFLTGKLEDINEDGRDELVVLEGDEERGYTEGAYIYDHYTMYPIPYE